MNWWNKIGQRVFGAGAEGPVETKAAKMFTLTDLFFQGKPLELLGGLDGKDAYSASWIAYAAIRRIAQYGSAVPLRFLSDPDDPESEVPDTHPTRAMFERPNPYFSLGEFMQWLLTMLNLRGEFFVVFDDPVRPTQMFQYTDPQYWHDIVSNEGYLEGWEYRHGQQALRYLPGELLHHKLICPAKPFRGQSPLKAALGPYEIEQGADELMGDIVRRGGEKALLYKSPNDLTPEQREQALQMLRGRRQSANRVGRDVLLPNGVEPVDPKFIEDDMRLLELGQAQPKKIAAAYGIPLSLLGFEDVDKFATFEGRKRMFYVDTMVPMLTGMESSFDKLFVEGDLNPKYTCYVRFNWDDVPAMQDDLGEKFDMAAKAHAAGLPWAVCNERFELGLDETMIPGADTVMVQSTLAPLDKLLEEWEMREDAPEPEPPAEEQPLPEAPAPAEDDGDEGPPADDPQPSADTGKAAPLLTNELIRKRSRDARAIVQRQIRLLKAERRMAQSWKSELQGRMKQAERAAKRAKTPEAMRYELRRIFEGLGEQLGEVVAPAHSDAAFEGQSSIVELVEGKMDSREREMFRKANAWRPTVATFMRTRRNFVVGMADEIFADVRDAAVRAVMEGMEESEVQHVIRSRFHSAPGGINRATTIARTEVGTAYSIARFVEISDQGFQQHEWITNGDEVVRETHMNAGGEGPVPVGTPFVSTGLRYPMEDGGPAEEVINCRCETLPVLQEGVR